MTVSDFGNYIHPGRHAHLIGIGGVSMSPLAEALSGMGLKITGSDISETPAIQHLRKKNLAVTIGHRADNIQGSDFIIRTAAARDDNPEITAAHAAGIPVFERAQAWGYIMRQYKNAVCIAGTHGKTTTTSMATHILMASGEDPTVMIGGTLPKLHAGHRMGGGHTIILESCEYYNSFHSFFPTVAVILNVEADHLDFFKDLDDIKKSFREFAAIVPENGTIIANADDENTMDALAPLNRDILTFGLKDGVRIRGVNIRHNGTTTEFDVKDRGEYYTHITLQIPGTHNVMNALAAVAAAIALGLPPEASSVGLADFTGAIRRFEAKGTVNGAHIYDDYAHHPSELKVLLDSVFTLGYTRVIVAFQPHTFSRTKSLFDAFVSQLKRPDMVFLSDIYAAREKNTMGISSQDLAAKLPGAVYCSSFQEMGNNLRQIASPGDIILTIGAGDIYKVGENLVK